MTHIPPMSDAVYKLSIQADKDRAWLYADALAGEDELTGPGAPSCAINLIANEDADWVVEAYYSILPEAEALQATLLRAGRAEGQGKAGEGGDAAPLPPLSLEFVPGQDWVAKSQRDLAPVRAGRFFIHGSHDRAKAKGRPGAIEIDAGRAFGTAHHGTTKGCLLALEALAKRRRFNNALDLGCGSGVLAIGAAKMGVKRVLATDIDPIAIMVARGNCRLNGVAPFVGLQTAPGLAHQTIARRAPFDLIMANILAAPLLTMADSIRKVAACGGNLVLSGLLDRQAREICGRYQDAGFVLRQRVSLEGWSTLTFMKR
jgi:ribosomal protein L11 methyltransferase